MKANRTVFTYAKKAYRTRETVEAYIAAETYIMTQAAKGHDVTGVNTMVSGELINGVLTPFEFTETSTHDYDAFGNPKTYTPHEMIRIEMKNLEAEGHEALEREDYERMQKLHDRWEDLRKMLED